jgi:hypothetical protein
MIHEQVKRQLAYLKYWVDAEIKNEEDCKNWGIRYTPSNTKWKDIERYEAYKKEVEKNGDKNLLVMVKMRGEDGINMYGTYPFARRYVNEEYLIHRTEYGSEVLCRESKVNVVR